MYTLIDAVLIILGVKGLGTLIAKSKLFLMVVTIFGVLFLLGYSILCLKSAFNNEALYVKNETKKANFKKIMLTLLALTLLNPHMYLDTCILIGSIGGGYEPKAQNFFIFGVASASFVYFFT